MDQRRRARSRRRLVVPLVLAVSMGLGGAALVGTTAACGDDPPRPDAGVGDAGVDTPII